MFYLLIYLLYTMTDLRLYGLNFVLTECHSIQYILVSLSYTMEVSFCPFTYYVTKVMVQASSFDHLPSFDLIYLSLDFGFCD